MSAIAAGLVLGYALGSVPFGLLLTRSAGLGDIRGIGSGNIGATNVLRTGRKGLAALTLLLDALKGTLAVLIAGGLLGPEAALAAALGAIGGHCFPVWLGFRGGKGVATYLGCVAALDWRGALAFVVVWLAVAAASRYSSLAALTAALAPPLVLLWLGAQAAAATLALIAALVWFKHRENLARLLAGQESRIGRKA